jgi:cellobiose phosphorylase
MQYGYFDDAAREYVITNPKTPVKWINYVGTLAFGGFVDHTGGSLICMGDPALNRITKYIPQLPASDFKGEALYLRLPERDGYKVFSPFFVPTLDPCERFECRVGLGYTRIVSEFYGIRADVTIFVPRDDHRVLRDIRITNLRAQPISIDVIPVVEYSHFDALRQFTNADWVPQTMQVRAYREPNSFVILKQYAFMRRDTRINFFTSNHPVASWESDRKRFLGDNEYGTWANPLALQQSELSNYEAHRADNITALLHHLGLFQPNETKRIITQLGQAENLDAELPLIQAYRDEARVAEELRRLAAFWDEYLATLQVRTPDADMNRMLNIHNAQQCYITKQWSRDLSLYQLGFGARGIGFRDSAQDVMGVTASAPGESKELIVKLLHVQKQNGSAMHQFTTPLHFGQGLLNPLTMVATEGDSREREDRPHYYSDDHLWAVLAVCAYLQETGDRAYLDEMVPYYEKDKNGVPLEAGTVLDHLRRAIEFTHRDVGAHGLPLLGFADWNDTVNLAAGAESLFTANLYGKALMEMIELARYLGDAASAERYLAYYDEMKTRVNKHAWDGEWYVRYFDFDGQPLGSKSNAQGQIYINSQSWAVISGLAPRDRAEKAMDSVYARLNTRNGIKVSTPGFDGFDPTKGGITTYPPGAKENGGIFLHTNPWAMIAETILGRGDRAFEYYRQINPAAKNDCIDEFECEPYVYPQNILGDEHPQFGLARNSWLTGTASWVYQAGTKYILGILPTYQGLQIDPCIPQAWDGFTVTRRFRGAVYEVVVQNPQHVCKGVRAMVVDGKSIPGNIVPIFDDGARHRVEVVLG